VATVARSRRAAVSAEEAARRQFVFRFSFGTTSAFILCEWMGWQPSAIAPVLTAVLLANLPFSPPAKVGLALVTVMGISAWAAFFLTTFLNQVPYLLFAATGLIMFIAFVGLAHGKAQIPLTLLLICFTVTPVFTLALSQYTGLLPSLLVRAMALAMVITWLAFSIWPRPSPKRPAPPEPPAGSAMVAAVVGTVTVLPLMLAFMLFGITDAMPVLLTTVLLVAKMEQDRSAANAWAKLVANLMGGFVAVFAYYLLAIAPSLAALALISFLIAFGFAIQIVKGGARGGNALLGYNAAMIIFGIALLKGQDNAGTWSVRVLQFALAGVFAVGMMALLWPRKKPAL
jgi:hypothetical protein